MKDIMKFLDPTIKAVIIDHKLSKVIGSYKKELKYESD